jgi:hypothetical protein
MARYQRLPKVITAQGRDLASLARDYTEPALNKLIGLMQNGKTEAVQAQCAQYILDRGWGRIPQMQDQANGPITVEIVYRQRDQQPSERVLIDVTPAKEASPK